MVFGFNKILCFSLNIKDKAKQAFEIVTTLRNALFVIYCFMFQIPCVYLFTEL